MKSTSILSLVLTVVLLELPWFLNGPAGIILYNPTYEVAYGTQKALAEILLLQIWSELEDGLVGNHSLTA